MAADYTSPNAAFRRLEIQFLIKVRRCKAVSVIYSACITQNRKGVGFTCIQTAILADLRCFCKLIGAVCHGPACERIFRAFFHSGYRYITDTDRIAIDIHLGAVYRINIGCADHRAVIIFYGQNCICVDLNLDLCIFLNQDRDHIIKISRVIRCGVFSAGFRIHRHLNGILIGSILRKINMSSLAIIVQACANSLNLRFRINRLSSRLINTINC